MRRGYIKLWRKSLDAGWIKNHKLWVLWTYCLLKASHKEFKAIVGLQNIALLPGQFIFGLRKASEKTGLTIREIRTVLSFLKRSGNLTMRTTNKFSIITIINWDTYQEERTDTATQSDNQRANKGQHTNIETHKENTPEKILEKISNLKLRYQKPELIDRTIEAMASTRRSNRIAESVVLAQLEKWQNYPAAQVEAALRTYLEKDSASQGKGESYLLGIIRNGKFGPVTSKTPEWY